MANKVKVTVSHISEKTTNGNFIHKLRTEGKTIKVLGQDLVGAGQTYYVALKGASNLNEETVLDLDMFDVVERPFTPEPDESGEVVTMQLKWLYPKR